MGMVMGMVMLEGIVQGLDIVLEDESCLSQQPAGSLSSNGLSGKLLLRQASLLYGYGYVGYIGCSV